MMNTIDADTLLEEFAAIANSANDLADAYANRTPETTGAFKTNGVVYQVKLSGTGRPYAKVLRQGTFEYVAGAIYKVREVDRLTMEQAIAESALLGACVICSRVLSDPKSVAKGIGPVCAKRVAA